jgi:hypothetical protein
LNRGEGRIEDPVAGVEGPEDKRLEKPAGVRQMPFGRADIGHRLDRLVLGGQVGGETFGVAADGLEAVTLGVAVAVERLWARRCLDGCIEQLGSPAVDPR